MVDFTYWQRRQAQIHLLDCTEEALRQAGALSVKRRGSKQVLTPTAILTPAWYYDRHGESQLVLRVKGQLTPVELGALHLRGIL